MGKHHELGAEYAHIPGYHQPTDPGAIGAGKLWVDTNGGTGNWVMKLRNDANDGWEALSGGSGFTDHGALTGLVPDDDHTQYHTDARGDARYSLLGHVHTESDITDLQAYLTEAAADLLYEPLGAGSGVYLPLAGGVMSGNIDFSDVQEGLRFWDLVSAYYKAFYFDDTLGMIVIGDSAPGLGGPPQVWAKSPRLNAGFAGVGVSDFGLWMDDAGDFVTVLSLVDTGPLNVGDASYDINLQGSDTRPKFNSAEIALLSDVPVGSSYDPQAIPRMQIGSGQAHVSVIHGLAFDVSPIPWTGSPGARICARDFIRFIRGGATVLNYKLELMSWGDSGGGPPTMAYSPDPTSPLDLFTDLDLNVGGTIIVRVWYQDGTTGDETYVETYFLLQDNQGIIPPPGP